MSCIEIDVTVKHKTDKAYLVTVDEESEVWVPRSMIDDEVIEDGEVTAIFIPEWLALEKGLI